jgi:hypothetical protein
MLERLGKICGWTGDRLGILFFIGAIAAFIFADDTPFADALLVGTPGVVAFLIGRAIRYVLVPPTQSQSDLQAR